MSFAKLYGTGDRQVLVVSGVTDEAEPCLVATWKTATGLKHAQFTEGGPGNSPTAQWVFDNLNEQRVRALIESYCEQELAEAGARCEYVDLLARTKGPMQ
jgi:hypothetical protein